MVSSKIKGIIIKNLNQISDDRGSVLHMLRSDSNDFKRFGECYFSEVLPGKIKAWKRHKNQTQNLAVPIGLIKIVLLKDSLIEEHIIGRPNNYFRITIPPGIIYGFSCIGTEKALIVNCADLPHDPHESESFDLSNKNIPYKWN